MSSARVVAVQGEEVARPDAARQAQRQDAAGRRAGDQVDVVNDPDAVVLFDHRQDGCGVDALETAAVQRQHVELSGRIQRSVTAKCHWFATVSGKSDTRRDH
jgi:hypothetical protein